MPIGAELDAARAKAEPRPERDRSSYGPSSSSSPLPSRDARTKPPVPIDPPCYFNTGCCSFGDGDVTALEIADGEIRLVRWLDDEERPRSKLLVKDSLADVLGTAGESGGESGAAGRTGHATDVRARRATASFVESVASRRAGRI